MAAPTHRPDARIVLYLLLAAFLVFTAWRWSLRAGRLEAGTAPTPATVPSAPPPTP